MSQDIEVCEPPSDSISALEFVPTRSSWSKLAAASWDQSVRVWDVQTDQGTAIPRCMHMMDSPVLDIAWNEEGSQLYMGDGAGKVHGLDLATNTASRIGDHAAGVSCCNLMVTPLGTFLMTASWDKTVKFWDLRCNRTIFSLNLPGRAYAADVMHPVAVVACAGQKLISFSLDEGHKGAQQWDSPSYGAANSQVRAVAITKGVTSQPHGWFLAKSDGMVIMQSMDPKIQEDWYFTCHRKQLSKDSPCDVYAVHDIKINHEKKTLATVGSDGSFEFWDYVLRSQLMRSNILCGQASDSITKCSISGDGRVFAYAVGYDWAKGHEYYDPTRKPRIILRSVVEDMKSKYC